MSDTAMAEEPFFCGSGHRHSVGIGILLVDLLQQFKALFVLKMGLDNTQIVMLDAQIFFGPLGTAHGLCLMSLPSSEFGKLRPKYSIIIHYQYLQ